MSYQNFKELTHSPTILHIDIDAFFAAAEVLVNPALKGKPVIVGGDPGVRGVVSTASYEARRYGIHSGMSLSEAQRRCPRGIFLRGNFHLYARLSRQFFDCLREFSPDIEVTSIDEGYVGLKGMRYLYSSSFEAAKQIKKRIEARIGIGVSIGLGFSRLGAKLATEAAKPGGIFCISDEREYVSNLSLEKIPGIGHHTLLILNGMGIYRVRELEERYHAIWKRTVGYPMHFASKHYPGRRRSNAKSMSRETTFPHDIIDPKLIKSHLAYLTGRLASTLSDQKLYSGRVEVKVRFTDFSTFTKGVSLPYPTYGYKDMWRLVSKLADDLLQKKDKALRLVGVKVEDLTRRRGLLPFISLKNEEESRGIFQIKTKYGTAAIFTGQEMLLDKIYKRNKEGYVLKTASLTK